MSIAAAEYCALVNGANLSRTDAIVVLCGEDAIPRVECAVDLYRGGVAPVIALAGGVHNPPHRWRSIELAQMMGNGFMDEDEYADVMVVDGVSTNTWEQANIVLKQATELGWTSITIVASNYHIYRAHLTFLQAHKAGGPLIFPCGVPQDWNAAPLGMTTTRRGLLGIELGKIEEYAAKGHVAGYGFGITAMMALEYRDIPSMAERAQLDDELAEDAFAMYHCSDLDDDDDDDDDDACDCEECRKRDDGGVVCN